MFGLRCFFVNTGSLIASVQCSPPNEESLPTFAVMHAEDIGSLLEFTLLPSDTYWKAKEEGGGATAATTVAKKCLKCQVEQAWVFSKILNRRQLLNVFVLSLSGEMELICLMNADYAALVGAVGDLLDAVGKPMSTKIPLVPSFSELLKDPCCRSQQSERLIERVASLLGSFRPSLPTDSYVFLSNMERTCTLLNVCC